MCFLSNLMRVTEMKNSNKHWLKLIVPPKKHKHSYHLSNKRKGIEVEENSREEQGYMNGKLTDYMDMLINARML